MGNVPIMLLAAGGSSRMGQPKQLLPWGNLTLIEHQIQTITKTGSPVNVVLGSNVNLVFPVIEKYGINIFIHENWENGMGSSIALGVQQITTKFPEADGILIALLDQPLISTSHFKKMTDIFLPGKRQIVISQSSSGWQGVPVLFDSFYFEELKQLKGDEGARQLTVKYKNEVTTVECGDQTDDMDTPEKYQDLVKRYFQKSK